MNIVLLTDPDPARCKGLKARYAVRCQRRGVTHPTQLCATHRGQDYCCRACREDETCDTHGKAA